MNIVAVLVFRAEMNGLMYINILSWIADSCLFCSPDEVVLQCTVLPPSLWLFLIFFWHSFEV